ncbi:aldehyde dehydrogenase family protein [Crossiella cryophila]|uniref:Acyl-CoA reductase-like NAD-dependent aldehyde dehydrogenase n=1 Tax=Crossiella cryophila TaxID=43355 RepID=A0A7W7CKD6_9PSEU|nr:aldehyde dehydrogenase [Crossiella cryophila]MBB4681406.1 acyl-CoA reductase-like NAD-dependent aldehyde dehydrogenase [Crossiella cryophila]
MRSYSSYIAGSDYPGDSWVYTINANAFLNDFMSNLKVKRELERGSRDDGAELPNVTARCAVTSDEHLQEALVKAREAAPVWGAFPLETRLLLAQRVQEEVTRRREEFIDVLVAEGHPRKLAEWEIAGIQQAATKENLDLWRRQLHEEHQVGPRKLRLVRKPDGVVVLSPPQNAAASNSFLGVPALVAGNALVVKAPRSSPYGVMFGWREIVAPILEELGAPPGTLSLVCGQPKKIMGQWLDSPLVDDIFFFGGSERGIQLGQEAVARGKKPILELAGNDGVLVWKDADLDLAAEALTECFFGSGQICMVPKYAIAHPDIADALLTKLTALVAKIRPGYPDDPEVLLSPVMRPDEYFACLKEAVAAGAEVITGGHRLELDGSATDTGPFIAPTVLRVDGLDGARELTAVREETFFPLLPIVVPETDDGTLLDAAIAFLNANQYGLRNSLWAKDPEVIEAVANRVNTGGLLKVNDSHIGFVPYLASHGGTGLTGGPFGELNYPLLRTSHLQGISIAEGVQPRLAVFETGAAPEATR